MAVWVRRSGVSERIGLFIGGESAGAHLASLTLLRLRDRHGLAPFRGANLFAGCYDLSLTPSVANWGGDRLILNTRDVRMFTDYFCGPDLDRRDPDDFAALCGSRECRRPCFRSAPETCCWTTRFSWRHAGHRPAIRWISRSGPAAATCSSVSTAALSEQALSRIDGFLTAL